jgi:hypothetical protein
MSEQHNHPHAHTEAPVNPLSVPIEITRNGQTQKFTVFEGKREAWKGRLYQAPQLVTDGTDGEVQSDTSFVGGLNWIGKNNIRNFLNTILKRFGQDFVDDATGDEGTADEGIFSIDKFQKFWMDLKSSALKLSELQEAYQEEVEAYKALTNEFLLKVTELSPDEIAAYKKQLDAAGVRLNAMKKDFDERKAKKSKEAQAETVSAV